MRLFRKAFLCLLLTVGLQDSIIAQIQLDVAPEPTDSRMGERDVENERSLPDGRSIHDQANRNARDGEAVFGAHLFQGAFREMSFSGFSPEYRIAIGDAVQLMLWGGMTTTEELTVDPQGNLFIPEVGPVKVAGVRNADLHTLIAERINSVFSDTVQSYAVLGSAQPVKVFVTGAIRRPGLYDGFSSDSILRYLDQAGGISLDEGSFIDISVIRGNQTIENHNLYDFLVDGQLSQIQFADGDRILIHPLRSTYTVQGAVRTPYRFEFKGDSLPLADALALAQVEPNATNLSIERETNGRLQAATYSLDAIDGLKVYPGDSITLTSDLKPESLLITIEGEHGGEAHQVHPYGATVADVIARISPSDRSDIGSIQLYRESVAERQKKRINESLDNLERSILSARSGSLEEAKIRAEESELILRFVQRARNTEPRGHVILGLEAANSQVVLEDGDVIYIPSRTNLVAVHGQIVFPTTQVWQDGQSAEDYIQLSGGLTDNADKDRILIVQTNGVVRDLKGGFRSSYRSYEPQPGEEIIVLAKPDTKDMQFAKDVSTIVYQIAIAAAVAIGI